jgi:branched-subunit amino acid transport protein
MTWVLVLSLAAGAFAFKVLGLVVIGGRTLPPVVTRCIALIPPALFAALIVKDTFSVGRHLQLDVRAAGVAAAAIAAWRKLPIAAVIVVGAAVTAGIRALS